MYVIVSHDVDHLLGKEHWFKDLYYPKMWIRESLHLIKGKIRVFEWYGRVTSCFRKERNQVHSLLRYDLDNGVPSTFFFGMEKGLGMSYSSNYAKRYINEVKQAGLFVGVHGICFDDLERIRSEKETFFNCVGFEPDGVRIHYVNYNIDTFNYLSKVKYSFDSTEFDKRNGYCIKNPYLVEEMVEFPITIMDSYISYNFEEAKAKTIDILCRAKDEGLKYITVLFHDLYFCQEYIAYKKWYEWLITYLNCSEEYEIISFCEAVRKIKEKNARL